MYDRPTIISYSYNGVDMGAGNVTKRIPVPRGARSAQVLDIAANVTEGFTQTTTAGEVQVGYTGDLDALASMSMGDAAINTAYGFKDTNGYVAPWNKDANDVEFLIVTFIAPTGGTPAGIADFTIPIAWDFVKASAD